MNYSQPPRLLFDQNLSHRLPQRLVDLFPDSKQVRSLGMDQSTDTEIWKYAAEGNYIVVTYDSDFAERSKLWGGPPKIIWLRCGNSSAKDVEQLLRKHAQAIIDFANQDVSSYLEIFQTTE